MLNLARIDAPPFEVISKIQKGKMILKALEAPDSILERYTCILFMEDGVYLGPPVSHIIRSSDVRITLYFGPIKTDEETELRIYALSIYDEEGRFISNIRRNAWRYLSPGESANFDYTIQLSAETTSFVYPSGD